MGWLGPRLEFGAPRSLSDGGEGVSNEKTLPPVRGELDMMQLCKVTELGKAKKRGA